MANKAFYSGCVTHWIKFYVRYEHSPNFSKVEAENWTIVDEVLTCYSASVNELLRDIYKSHDTLPTSVYKASKKHKYTVGDIWKLIGEIEHKIAVRKGCI